MSQDDWSHEAPIRPLPGPLSKKEQLARHWQALELSSDLTELWRRMHRPKAVNVTPERVLKVLNRAGIRPVLIGLHGIGRMAK